MTTATMATTNALQLLELEHVIGVTGRYPETLRMHPAVENTYITAIGMHVVVNDIYDPHNQKFLKGHDADVSALDVSSSGRLIASGQVRSPNAPVRWDSG
jgi:hypothetical protein